MSQSGPITDCKEIAQSIKGQKPPFKCPACKREYKSLTGIFYHIGQIGPSTSVPRCLTNEESNPHNSPSPSHSGLRPRRSATPPATPSTAPATRATTPATMASVMAAALITPSHPSSPVSSVGGVTASGRRRPRKELTWGETQRLVEVEFDSNYRRVEIDFDLEISDEERQPVAEATASTGRRGTPQKRGRGSAASNETPSRGGAVATIGKPANLSTVKDKCKKRSKLKSKNDMVPLPKAEVTIVDGLEFSDAPMRGSSYYRFVEQSAEDLDENVEYDMDEEDYQWLSLMNDERKSQGLTSVPQEVFEILMDRLEKECIFESQTFADGDDRKNIYNIDENAVCCICNDGECHNTNAILFCDMCNLAVHQECYGVPYIPEGQWLCRRCIESPSRGVDCALCPNKGGAFKRTLDARWAHVICAIWIPEVQFANPVFLEPIDGIKEIPAARWKLTCYICRRRMGACIQCSKSNCCTAFHVTCAQQACLYMKIEPAKGGTVKKTAYCDAHTPPSVKRKMEKAAKELEMKEAKGRSKDNDGGKASEGSESGKNGSGKKGKMEGENKKEAEGADEVVDVVDGKDAATTASTDGSKKGKEHQDDNQDSDDDLKPHRVLSSNVLRARKMMEEKRGQSNVPVVNIPFVPQNRLDHIIGQVSVMKKSQFIPKLVNYWKLKRQSRNGVPLLRRLQANKGQRAATTNLTDEERSVLVDQLALWNSLRHDLERARMLVELVRKREKLKREQLRLLMAISELQLRPLNFILKKALDRIARKDPAKIFADPVSIEDVPDYLDIIRKPMDFYTMRKKLESNGYTCLEDFEKDFKLVWHNATIYNQKDTIYYKAAIRIKEAGQKVLEQAKLQVATAGIHCKTGLHYPDVEDSQPGLSHSSSSSVNGQSIATHLTPPINVLEMNDESMLDSFRERRYSTTSQVSLEEQMDVLQEKLQMLQGHTGSQCRRKEKALRKELSMLRRQQKHERKNSADTEDHSSVSSPRRHRAPSIPRNAEELASHLIHGSLRFTPSRQQILSYSGIRLEERASALKKEEEAAAAAREQQQATLKAGKERGRLHSSSDSMLLVRNNRHRSETLTGTERGNIRGQSSEPSYIRGDSDDNEDHYKTANSSASDPEEVIPTRKRKRIKEQENEEVGEEEARSDEAEPKRKRVKKRRRERHKEDQEDDKSHAKNTPGISKISSSSRSKGGNKESRENLFQTTPRPQRPSSAASKRDVIGKRHRKIRRDEDYEEDYDDDDDDYDGQGVDDEKDLSFSIERPKSRGRNKKTPATFSLKQPKAVATPKQSERQTRMRIKSSETVTTESEVEGSRSEGVMGRWVNGNAGGGNKPRKSGRLSAALRSSSIEESDTGATARKKRQERCRRSRSSSIYETAGEADFSEFESKRAERQKRNRKKPNSYFSDSENRDVFSEGLTTPPSATSTKDLTLHINETPGANTNSRRGGLDLKKGGSKRKRSSTADRDGRPDEKKSRMDLDATEGVQHGLKSGGMVNGLVMNGGDRATLPDEIRPMELVWAKCRGYPPYPALVINPDIPENGIVVRGEKILPPSDEVMELKDKNPTSTYLVRFFDGRRTWQCLPPEKIEPLGTSVESDNAKIAMAGSSKRSVKEAFARAKQWLQRKDKKSSNSTPKSSSHDSEPSRYSVDSDGEDYREV